MPQSDTCAAQEATVLSESQLLLKQLAELDGMLAEVFDKVVQPTGAQPEVRPDYPNVLDEALHNFRIASQRLSEIHAFIRASVINKIL